MLVLIRMSSSMASPYKSLFRIRNIPLTRILTRVSAYLFPFISQILDFLYWTVLIFIWSILNGVTLKTSNSNCRVIVASLKQIAAGKNERDPLTKKTKGAIHSTKIPTGPTGKSGPSQKVDPFFRNFSGWTEPIHWVLDRNFRKFWLNGSRPKITLLLVARGGGGYSL